MKELQLNISGMSCKHCAMSVKNELGKIDGVSINSVEIGSAKIIVDELKVNEQQLYDAVKEAGYSISIIK
ncbi:MAG: heavy-metal-associated domain-containing protein [Bacteroidota bacterium]